ncbi:Calcium-binding protein 8, partial [Lamprotornis superbus]
HWVRAQPPLSHPPAAWGAAPAPPPGQALLHSRETKADNDKHPLFSRFCGREKMPFHHVTAGLLYKGNYLNRSLSAGSDSEQLANISELGMAMRSLGYMPSEVELAIIMQRLDMDEGRDGFLGNTIDSIFWQFDMQRITLEELKHILYHAFRDHLTMKDIENIIINEEESLNENSGNCQTDLICAFAMAFIISVMLIAANQILRSGME